MLQQQAVSVSVVLTTGQCNDGCPQLMTVAVAVLLIIVPASTATGGGSSSQKQQQAVLVSCATPLSA
jgi:hypothetical protein